MPLCSRFTVFLVCIYKVGKKLAKAQGVNMCRVLICDRRIRERFLMVVSLWLPLLGALVHPIARASRARVIATASAAAAPPAIGEPLQVWIDCGEEDGS